MAMGRELLNRPRIAPTNFREDGAAMNDGVKIALIIMAGLVMASAIYVYFSPYQSCMRTIDRSKFDSPEVACGRAAR
jgi:hypothetical protein